MVYDLIVVGAGIIGLASSYQFFQKSSGVRVLVLEKELSEGCHQTGHNSGVLHSGIYYKPGSLKAKNCRRGYLKMLDYCQEKGIPYELCGKLIAAIREEERERLHEIYSRGLKNGLEGLEILSAQQVKEVEPHVVCLEGVWVPQAGIVDYSVVAKSLLNDCQNMGITFQFDCQVINVLSSEGGKEFIVETTSGDFRGKKVLNCAGVYSDRLVSASGKDLDIRIIPFRGEYYNLRTERRGLVKNLIYPVPDPQFPFLGIHFTRRIGGGVEVGPNAVFAFHREGYNFFRWNTRDVWESLSWPGFRKLARRHWYSGWGEIYRSLSRGAFLKAAQKLLPEIQTDDLEPGGAGVRAQGCYRNGDLCDDFVVIREEKNYVSICNAPSPAATASLAIGEHIAEILYLG